MRKFTLFLAALFCVSLPTMAEDIPVGHVGYQFVKNIPMSESGSANVTFTLYDSINNIVAVYYTSYKWSGNYLDYIWLYGDDGCTVKNGKGKLVIPQTVSDTLGNTYTVGGVGAQGLASLNITAIELPPTITTIGKGAFWYNSKLTEINLPEGLTRIYDGAFNECTGLTQVTLPSTLDTLDGFASTGLTSIVIPASVKCIDDGAFDNCKSLANVDMSAVNNLQYLGSGSFSGCKALESFDFTKLANTLVSSDVFSYSGMKEVNWPEANGEVLLQRMFSGCDSLKRAILPTSLTELPEEIFYNCHSLDSININQMTNLKTLGVRCLCGTRLTGVFKVPETVETIESAALAQDTALTRIILPQGLTTIKSAAFYGCSNITAITLPEGLTTLGSSAFGQCSKLQTVNIMDLKNIKSIDSNTFTGCQLSGELHFPENITSVSREAFMDNSGLTKVYFHDKFKNVERSAFQNCTGVTDVYFDNITIKWGYNGSLVDFTNDCSIKLHVYEDLYNACVDSTRSDYFQSWYNQCPDAFVVNTEVKPGAYAGVLTMDLVDENGAKTGEITTDAYVYSASGDDRTVVLFSVKTDISDPYLPEEMLTSEAYDHGYLTCTGRGTLVIPDSMDVKGDKYAVAYIGSREFRNCDSITGIVLPKALREIGYCAFENDSNIVSFTDFSTLPHLQKIHDYAFSYCNRMSGELRFPEGMTYVSGFGRDWTADNQEYFDTLPNFTKIILPSTIKTIGTSAFSDTNIETLVIPDSCETIGYYAFYGAKHLKNIYFPVGCKLKTIGKRAFAGWIQVEYTENNADRTPQIEQLILPEGLEIVGEGAFAHARKLRTVSMPSTLKELATWSFAFCYELDSMYWADNSQLQTINSYAFEKSPLTMSDFILPRTISYIGRGAWAYSSPRNIFVPKELPLCGPEVWSRVGFQRLEFEDGYRFVMETTVGGYYDSDTVPSYTFSYTGREDGALIILPEGIAAIDESAFSKAHIDSVVLPQSLREIKTYAFSGAELSTPVTIPAGVRVIGKHAFNMVNDVPEVIFETPHPDSIVWQSPDENDFGTPEYTTLRVHRGIYNQCKLGVREDAFQYWFTFGDSTSVTEIPDPDMSAIIEPVDTPEPTETPIPVVNIDSLPEDPQLLLNDYVDGVLYTLQPAAGDSVVVEESSEPEEPDMRCIQIASTVSIDYLSMTLANLVPGTSEWADNFNGLSFLIPAGEGTITLDLKVTGDFKLGVFVGAAYTKWTQNEKGTIDIHYTCGDDTWVHICGAEGSEPNPSPMLRKRGLAQLSNYARIYGISIGPKKSQEGVEQTESQEPSAKSQKFLRNGVLLIERNGRIYDATGAQMK